MVEQEIKEHDVLNTSTPMKNKKHKFLRRGEGLKRFEKGNNAFQPKKSNNKKKNLQVKNNKGVAFDIQPPPPPTHSNHATKETLTKKKPHIGLPLKLKLNRQKQQQKHQQQQQQQQQRQQRQQQNGPSLLQSPVVSAVLKTNGDNDDDDDDEIKESFPPKYLSSKS